MRLSSWEDCFDLVIFATVRGWWFVVCGCVGGGGGFNDFFDDGGVEGEG